MNIEGKQNWAKVSNTPMTEPGWVPFEEEITVVDQAKEETALAKEAADKEAALAKKRRGRASTILTKPGSIMGPPTLRTASLLGTKQRFGE